MHAHVCTLTVRQLCGRRLELKKVIECDFLGLLLLVEHVLRAYVQ